jgi:hypothetical protein
MYKLLLLLVIGSLLACNNSGTKEKKDNAATTSSCLPADSNARAATFSFVDGCMQNFRIALGEPKAYAFCKCVYNQLKEQNPKADSLLIEELALDTARVAALAAKCR